MQRSKKIQPIIRKKAISRHCPSETQTLDLLDINFKLTLLNTFKELEETMSKELKKSIKMMSHKIESINLELEIIKRNCEKLTRVAILN